MLNSNFTLPCQVIDLGLIDYGRAYEIQKQKVLEVIQGKAPAFLLVCEHPPVFTLGRLGTEDNFLATKTLIEESGIQIVWTDRGGDVTLHAPGQIVTYPILNLIPFGRDLKAYLEKLEEVAIDFLKDFDILANGISGQRGVWVGQKKIASIGIGVRKWVSFHGMAININTDLNLFSLIRPCGLNVQMTSVKDLLKKEQNMAETKQKIIESYSRHFQLELV